MGGRGEGERTYLEILHEVVEDAEAFWVFAVGDFDEGADLGGLGEGMLVLSTGMEDGR